jgi:hypothetical protein
MRLTCPNEGAGHGVAAPALAECFELAVRASTERHHRIHEKLMRQTLGTSRDIGPSVARPRAIVRPL